MALILKCPQAGCGKTNRLPFTTKRVRCGACQHIFTPQELIKAQVEPEAPTRGRFDLEQDDDADEVYYACKDEDECGWEGREDECDTNDAGKRTCPECGKKVRRVDD